MVMVMYTLVMVMYTLQCVVRASVAGQVEERLLLAECHASVGGWLQGCHGNAHSAMRCESIGGRVPCVCQLGGGYSSLRLNNRTHHTKCQPVMVPI